MSQNDTPGVVYVREVMVQYRGPRRALADTIKHPRDAVRFALKVVTDDSREHFLAIYLDARHRPIAHSIVSIGTATAALVHPREVFQAGVLVGAVAIVLAHNHPSGDAIPSNEDRVLSERLQKAGEILGITVLDSVVWARDGGFTSLFDQSGEIGSR